ncbi:PREDICTED: uncharacterized protein LOC105107486 [Populus euphratica]|uniref:Uncharacterized protein LOC105107486 n=1 Tax=Populus euphratica TaxID=75702 RepID=A0AAJ6SVB9_POPEU|nr:PREDICTED: uncharacterized protein LOC105107486 [Populus euphratica]
MSPANSCALLLLFFLTLSLHINFSTSDNSNIGVSRRTVAAAAAAAADTVPLQKEVATFLPSDISPPTEKYWFSRLPNTPLPKALGYLPQPSHYPSISTEFANEIVSVAASQRTYKQGYRSVKHKTAIKSALPDSTIFYLYNDLQPGKRMRIHFTNSGTKVSFLPRQVAESIPFSSDKVPEILNYFALQVNSKEAQVMRDEIGGCEEPNMEGEEKFCATSLESLIDFSVERLGLNVRVLSRYHFDTVLLALPPLLLSNQDLEAPVFVVHSVSAMVVSKYLSLSAGVMRRSPGGGGLRCEFDEEDRPFTVELGIHDH